MSVRTESLYECDYYQWLTETVNCLKARDFTNLDLKNLIEEIEELGRREKYAIASYLMRLCEHLLKLQYWETERQRCYRGWLVEVRNFRKEIKRRLQASPSLKPWIQDIYVEEYRNGRQLFLDGSGLASDAIPETPPFTLAQALDENWLPADLTGVG
ncbi:MAG: DUF29 domain-containing protein [Gloeomargarita sp. SKYBB_i_bin120]|nr:DUF29 domain-containing protein [Gloeomargarita sp. SKYB120]MDW8178872.1 DUF29 domain-containing protein [Gloeomargarita sp. SKYBB_i_bin120]